MKSKTKCEIWKDVPEWEGIYKVSNLGRVKKLTRPYKRSHNRMIRERVIKLAIMGKGYLSAVLCNKGVRKVWYVHRLVMLAFVGESKLTVDHINGKRDDNMLSNLRYCDQRQNIHYGRIRRKCVSKYIGVYKAGIANLIKPFQASIWHDGKRIRLGYFKTEFQAHLAYQSKLKELNKQP